MPTPVQGWCVQSVCSAARPRSWMLDSVSLFEAVLAEDA